MNQVEQLRQAMKKLQIARLALALAVSVGVVNFAVADGSGQHSYNVNVEGTWQAVETCCNGNDIQYQYTITFGAGADGNSGIVIHSESDLAGLCMNTQGVWKRVDDRTFIATYEGFCSNTATTPPNNFRIKYNASITLDESGETFQGTESISIISEANVTTGPFKGTLQGLRMQAEAP
jgi:hypothetical protein